MAETRGRAIRIVLLDDHALFRESIARLLNADRDFEIVASCGSIDEALAALRGARIDIVLLDFDLGQRDGAKFLRSAHEQGYSGKVLVVTAGVDKHEAADLIRKGVSGIFTKHHSAAMLAEGIRDVMSGKVWFDQELLREAIGQDKSRSEDERARFTERERLVLAYVFEGLANKEIAERIKVSESSVKATLQQLFAKTGVRTRSQLVRVALEQQKTDARNA
jgi:DNA-binding NarL/FixJ family response regulator